MGSFLWITNEWLGVIFREKICNLSFSQKWHFWYYNGHRKWLHNFEDPTYAYFSIENFLFPHRIILPLLLVDGPWKMGSLLVRSPCTDQFIWKFETVTWYYEWTFPHFESLPQIRFHGRDQIIDGGSGGHLQQQIEKKSFTLAFTVLKIIGGYTDFQVIQRITH